MMASCPKCGFGQPQDQFCAKCGVDMNAFRPARQPLGQRLVQSTLFQVVVLAVIVVSVMSVVRSKQRADMARRMAELEQAHSDQKSASRLAGTFPPALNEQQSSSTGSSGGDREEEQVSLTTQSASSVPNAQVAQDQAELTNEGASAHSNAFSSAPDSSQIQALREAARDATEDGPRARVAGDSPSNEQKAAAKPMSGIRVVFAELQKPFLAELVADTRSIASYGPMNFGVVANLSEKLRTAQTNGTYKSLDSSSPESLRINQPIVIFKGARDEASGQNVGLSLQVTPTAIEDETVTVQVEMIRSLRESSGTIEQQPLPIPDSFSIPKGGAAFISGSLPRRTLHESEERFYRSAGPLRVLASESYRSGVSEFVILIEPR